MEIIDRASMNGLFAALKKRGYEIYGPTVSDQAIVYDRLESADDLPVGWTDEQDGGTYRIKKRDDQALFGYVVGPHSWKKYLYPSKTKLWEAKRDEKGFTVVNPKEKVSLMAFIGVRACELKAIGIQDKVFLGSGHEDPTYKARREKALIIAVNCTRAAKTCFCSSMKTGPKVSGDFDLAVTELIDGGRHEFLIEIGSEKGKEIMKDVPHRKAEQGVIDNAEKAIKKAESQMVRKLDTKGIKELFYENIESPHWEEVAQRCLSCANCTMVCPTCFCSTVEEVTDLTGDHAERWRLWDSCFTMDFSYIHGGHVRSTTGARYRQWITHKLAAWQDQFDSSGCVGCGRCISWCPVGIDITQETQVLREKSQAVKKTVSKEKSFV